VKNSFLFQSNEGGMTVIFVVVSESVLILMEKLFLSTGVILDFLS
jgi:hypothetical protein